MTYVECAMKFLLLLALGSLALACTHRVSEPMLARYGELTDDAFFIDDPVTVCPVHRIATVPCEVRVADGMCLVPKRKYLVNFLEIFPYSFWNVQSCSCVGFGEMLVVRYVCPACRDAERSWRLGQGWRIDSEVKCDWSVE